MNLRGEEKMISSCVSGQDGRVLSERPRQKYYSQRHHSCRRKRKNLLLNVTVFFRSSVAFFIQKEVRVLTCLHVCCCEINSALHITPNEPQFQPMAPANQHKQPPGTHIHSTTITTTTTKKSHAFPHPQPRFSSLVYFQ